MNYVIHTETVFEQYYRHLYKWDDKMVWDKFFSNESGKLDHGVGNRVAGSNTIFFIPKKQVPLHWKVTHGRIVWDIRPQKSEIH